MDITELFPVLRVANWACHTGRFPGRWVLSDILEIGAASNYCEEWQLRTNVMVEDVSSGRSMSCIGRNRLPAHLPIVVHSRSKVRTGGETKPRVSKSRSLSRNVRVHPNPRRKPTRRACWSPERTRRTWASRSSSRRRPCSIP